MQNTEILLFIKMYAMIGSVINMYNYEQTAKISIEHGAKMRSFEMPVMHTHTCHELYFLISGERRYLIGSDLFDVSPGNVVIIPAGQLHRTTAIGSKGHARYVIYFSEGYMADFLSIIGRDSFDHLMHGRCLQLPEASVAAIHDILQKMERSQKENAPFAEASLKTDLQQILLHLLRYGEDKIHHAAQSADKIREATQYITENYTGELTLGDVASVACMEKTYFCKSFKTITGFGFNEYLTRVRMQAAESYLLKTDLSISEIASRCGFSGSNYFGDVFRRCYGISPSAYRRRNRT